jgi:hypothetical protein
VARGIAFWSAVLGLRIGEPTTAACRRGPTPCTAGTIERTANGGGTWELVDEVPGSVDSVAVVVGHGMGRRVELPDRHAERLSLDHSPADNRTVARLGHR